MDELDKWLPVFEKWVPVAVNFGNLIMSCINRIWPRRPDDKLKKPALQQRKKPHSGKKRKR